MKHVKVRYYDPEWRERDGILEEVNGNLAWIRDEETDEANWYSPHEWRKTHTELSRVAGRF